MVVRFSKCEDLPRINLYEGYFLVYDGIAMYICNTNGFAFMGIPAGFHISGDVLEELVTREFIPRVAPSELVEYYEAAGVLVFPKLNAEVMELGWGWVPMRDLSPTEAYRVFTQLASDYFPEDA